MDEKPIIRIANIIARDNQSLIYGNIHPEGITNDGNRYVYIFDFEYNGKTEIIKLTKKEYNVIAFRHCFFLAINFLTVQVVKQEPHLLIALDSLMEECQMKM